jgi:uncharacterized protein YcbX
MPTLDRITLYPVKSLDVVEVAEAHVLPSGGLENDRRWRLVDLDGRVVNAKRTAAFHPIRAEYDLAAKLISLSRWADLPPAEPREFSIGEARFLATNVCKRCVVPSRDSRSGAVTAHFRDAFEARRGRSLRRDVDASAWNHLYRLGIDTRPAATPSVLQLRQRVG